MLKKLCVVLLMVLMLGTSLGLQAAEKPSTGRLWGYANFTTLLSPNWAFVVMPGYRYEYSRKSAGYQDEYATFLYELFVGPVYIQKFGNLTLKLPLWYYYMGFDLHRTALDDYMYSHNLEFLPIVEYKYNKFTFINRVIFHNKFYASNKLFTEDSQRKGYSLLLRELFRINYAITDNIILTIADEIFVGLVEDEDTRHIARGEPFYAMKNLNKNRLYLGGIYKFTPFISLSTEYIYETNYNTHDNNKLKDRHHYVLMMFNYVLKLF